MPHARRRGDDGQPPFPYGSPIRREEPAALSMLSAQRAQWHED